MFLSTMFRPGLRLIQRSLPTNTRRSVHTISPRARSWKSSTARWGFAIGAVYYYNTSDLFAEEPAYLHHTPDVGSNPEPLPTIESLAQSRRQHVSDTSSDTSITSSVATGVSGEAQNDAPSAGVEDLEQEAGQQGAFNPETGEINWDCPCLGGMAHGPCGEQFKAAFSCFVFSKEDPKGMDCIDNFKGMQDCFREHPDIYGEEFDNEENEEGLDAAVTSNDTALSTEALESQGTDTNRETSQSMQSKSIQISPSEGLPSTEGQHYREPAESTRHGLSRVLSSDRLDNGQDEHKQESSLNFNTPPQRDHAAGSSPAASEP